MQRIELNMQVLAVNDLRIGDTVAVRQCCFEVERVHQAGRINLTPESIFSVDTGRVTLVCGVGEIHRYSCPSHRGPVRV